MPDSIVFPGKKNLQKAVDTARQLVAYRFVSNITAAIEMCLEYGIAHQNPFTPEEVQQLKDFADDEIAEQVERALCSPFAVGDAVYKWVLDADVFWRVRRGKLEQIYPAAGYCYVTWEDSNVVSSEQIKEIHRCPEEGPLA